MNEREIANLRKRYPKGTRVELIQMYDKQAPPPGTQGTVDYIDDIGSIHVQWDTGSTLALICDAGDAFKTVKQKA